MRINYLFDLKNAETADQARIYKNLHRKLRCVSQDIYFNKKCLSLKVVPNYISIKIKNNSISARRTLEFASKFWLRSEMKQLYIKRNAIKTYLKLLHTQLSSKLHPVEWDIFDDDVRQSASHFIYLKRKVQDKKIEQLILKKTPVIEEITTPFSDHKFHDRVSNLSTASFTPEQLNLLEKGLKYNPKRIINKKDLENLAVDVSVGAKSEDNIFKSVVTAEIKKFQSNSTPTTTNTSEMKILKTIQTDLKNKDLTLVKADKGNTIVILNRFDYIAKVNNFLTPDNFLVLNRDPTTNFNSIVRSFIKSCKLTCSENELFRLTNMNPQPPQLYGLPKIHKPHVPIRPVVSYVSAPAYKLAKKYNSVFLEHSKFQPSRSVTNTSDLINKIKNMDLPSNSRLVSFDVSNLFTNVPVSKALEAASDLLAQSHTHPLISHEIIEALNICSSQNYFQFNNVLYRQKSGLAMGSPLSPLLAEVFMNHFENNLFKSKNPLLKNIFYWYRYVDDIICCWIGSNRQLNLFLNFINSLEPSINFTLELDENKSINFLDLTIKILNNRHDFSIFRKPTHTDTIIPASSSHPWTHKLAFFNSSIHRLFNVPMSPDNFLKEVNVLKQMAVNNSYPSSLIDKLIHKKRLHFQIPNLLFAPFLPDSQQTSYFRLPFLPSISNKIKNLIPKNKYKVSFYTPTNLAKALLNCKTPLPPHLKSGVYQLLCQDCNTNYIGKTGRNFNTRIKEHCTHWIKKSLGKSNFADHLINNNHSFDPSSHIKYLHLENNYKKLSHLEIFEINKNLNNNLCNEQLIFSANSPLLQIKFF